MLKTLILIRHAKSSWGHPELRDFERPLNNRGLREAPEMGRRLRARDMKPDLILSSPAQRAVHTAELIAESLDYPAQKIHLEQKIYEASTGELVNIIRTVENQHNSLFLIGHNPAITYLSEHITGRLIENMPTCGISCIAFSKQSWNEVDRGAGNLVFFDYPKHIQSE